MFKRRKKNRCPNLSPSPHPSYARKRCELKAGHNSVCRISIGPYKHMWNQDIYELRGTALTVKD